MPQGRKSTRQRLSEAGHNPLPTQHLSASSPAPESIAGNPVAVEVWSNVCHTLSQQGMLQAADCYAIERYAVLVSVARAAAAEMMAGKIFETSRTGWRQVSTHVTTHTNACKALLALEKSLGLSPDARRLNKTANAEPFDELEEFLRVSA